MQTVTNVRDLRAALLPMREAGDTVALVPTMGALHAGHLSLIAAAKKAAKRVVASIFINPMQFAPTEDLGSYPRRLDQDQKLLMEAGCDLLYTPTADEIYPEDFSTTIDPGPLAKMLEGAFRPTHFRGVATVVVKLLLQVLPDAGFFGEKDYQQLHIIRHVVRDLNIPIHIIGAPIVRDADGLALSSRNVYLSADERGRAVALPRALQATAAAIKRGADIETSLAQGRSTLAEAGFVVDYIELVHASTLAPLRATNAPARLVAAARIGNTRLIDNTSV